MTKTILVWSCGHAKPDEDLSRFDWLGSLISDLKPDMTVDLGDGADMCSLSSYDGRYPQQVVTQNYERDIESYNESQDRIWGRFRISKRKRPFRVGLQGNHEFRLDRALKHDPRLEGAKYGISFSHYNTDWWFDEYHRYDGEGPAIADYEGISFSHYFSSGNYGTATSGKHHAYTILQNRACSSICGHSHKRDIYFKDEAHPRPIIGLVVGCYKGYGGDGWAGQSRNDWWHGVVVLRDVSQGVFDPEFISLARLEKEYG